MITKKLFKACYLFALDKSLQRESNATNNKKLFFRRTTISFIFVLDLRVVAKELTNP